jgi:hypothetical protein
LELGVIVLKLAVGVGLASEIEDVDPSERLKSRGEHLDEFVSPPQISPSAWPAPQKPRHT